MLSLRSLAAILYSAMRLSRAAFLRSPLKSKALINTQKNETNIATNMAINRAASMSVSYEQSTRSKARTGTLRRCPVQKQSTQSSRPSRHDVGFVKGTIPRFPVIANCLSLFHEKGQFALNIEFL
jgi:hypothetical protein